MFEAKYDQFIGQYPNLFSDELCDTYIKWWNMIQESEGVMLKVPPVIAPGESGSSPNNGLRRTDQELELPTDLSLVEEVFQQELHHKPLWENLNLAYNDYRKEYSLDQDVRSYTWKMHKVLPRQGYHQWHCEHDVNYPTRALVWMICLQAAEEGGETEFLHQSKRIKLEKGGCLIWPAGFTHTHRGSPPLKGEKMYITGWFRVV